jgi:acyl-CoA synthetase (AMP-forming)/AMP-acid ligase II
MRTDTLADVIRINAAVHPQKVAFICQDEQRSFREFSARVNRLVDALYKSGLSKGDRIGILSSNRIEFSESYGAAEKGGLIAVPLNIRHITSDIAYVVEHSGMKTIIAEGAYLGLIKDLPIERIYVFRPEPGIPHSYEELIATGEDREPDVQISPDDGVYMMYTGGTTGRPKGVLLDHGGQMANAKCTLIDASVEPRDILLTVMPMHHIGGKNFCTVHFHRSCTNVLMPSFQAATVLEAMAKHQIRCVLLAPTMIKMLLDELAGATPTGLTLNTVYYSSAPMPVPLLREAIRAFGRIFVQFYGLTESGPSGSMLRKEDHLPDGSEKEQRRLASAGMPQIYNEICIVDDNRCPLPAGQVGEVMIRGEQVMQRYWNNEAATAETLRDGWIASGDYGRIDEDGYLYIVGRKKDVIVSGGENIYPREIEEVLHAHPAVLECAVVGAPDPKWGEAVTAVVVLRDGFSLTESEAIEHCKNHLASFKKPKSVHFQKALPRSSLGKILKSEIRDTFWKDHERKI